MKQHSDDEILALMRDVEVPEPSPLFWDHLSQRVHDAVAVEPLPARGWLTGGVLAWSGGLAGLSAIAVLVIVVSMRHPSSVATAPLAQAVVETATAGSDLPDIDNDESLAMVGELASQMDWDDAQLAVAPGAVDRAISQLSPEETQAVMQYLREALKNANSL